MYGNKQNIRKWRNEKKCNENIYCCVFCSVQKYQNNLAVGGQSVTLFMSALFCAQQHHSTTATAASWPQQCTAHRLFYFCLMLIVNLQSIHFMYHRHICLVIVYLLPMLQWHNIYYVYLLFLVNIICYRHDLQPATWNSVQGSGHTKLWQ